MVDYDLLIPYGWTDSIRLDYAALLETECVPARVIRMDRGECDVATPTGLRRAICPRSDSEVSGLCTGDWVLIDAAMMVRRLLPRRSAIVRTTASRDSRAQVLAANVDTVLICTAADGDVDLGRIERMLALAWESQAQPVVVLTKADAAEYLPLDEVRAVAPGATVVAVSATIEYGLDVLTAVLDGTVALIGPSGAGKSTLANALLGADVFATNDVRAVDKKGKHTTVHRELRPLPGGGTLIDTPACVVSVSGRRPRVSNAPSAISKRWPPTAGSATARTTPNPAVRCGRPSTAVRSPSGAWTATESSPGKTSGWRRAAIAPARRARKGVAGYLQATSPDVPGEELAALNRVGGAIE